MTADNPILTGDLVDDRAALCQDLAAEAVASGRRSTEAWVALGAELLQQRQAMPSNQDFGAWLRRYNHFGVKHAADLSRCMQAAEYVVLIDIKTEDWQDIGIQRLARLGRDEAARRKREALPPAPAKLGFDLRLGDFRHVLADVTDADAIITDPPYPAEFLPLLDDLAEFADHALKPDGVMAVLHGQTHLPEVFARLSSCQRPYRWTACYLTPGNAYVSMARHVHSNWKPLLIYGGGPRFADVIEVENVKSRHKWGQSYQAFQTIVERLTAPGAVVVDPFAGHGTTMHAAVATGRHAVGAEIDPESYAEALRRQP